MGEWDLKKRTKQFAHDCVKLSMQLPKNCLGEHIKKQLIRSCTSVAANYRAALVAQSRAGFISKLSIVIEEVDESCFWLEFVSDENFLAPEEVRIMLNEARELTSIFVSSRKTATNEKAVDAEA